MREHNDVKVIAADDIFSIKKTKKKTAKPVPVLVLHSYQLQVQLQGHREGKQTKESANTDPSNKKTPENSSSWHFGEKSLVISTC